MSCLTTDTLERLALGFLPDDGPALDHLSSCDSCHRRLDVLRKEHAALASAARTVSRHRTRRPMSLLWRPLAVAAAVHVIVLGALVAFFQEAANESVDDIVLLTSSVRTQNEVELLQDVPRIRDVFERKGLPRDDRAMPVDEPGIFFPEVIESDHAESADNEDHRVMKSDSRDFLSYIKGEAGGTRGRSAGRPVYDTMGVGGGPTGGRMGKGTAGPARATAARADEPRRGPEGGAGMIFKDQGTNPTIRTADECQSTFGLDVDTASYTKIRDFLMRGVRPPKEAVRVEECVNYFRYADPKPALGTFAVRLEAAPSPFADGRHLMRIAIQSREPMREERKAVRLTFVIDVSGSMAMDNRLELVKRSLDVLVNELRPDDRIGIVVYGSTGRKLLDPTPVARKERIQSVITSLHTEGSTNLEQGVDIGYDLAAKFFDPEATNRVVICTDGVANNGVTDPKVLLENVKEKASKGIWLSVFGFGMDNYNDHLMMTLADKGNGNYAYIDTFQEAKKIFTGKRSGLFEVAAADAKAQVEFNPNAVTSYRLIGYEKRKLENQDFRNDKIDAGELSLGHHVTALYEMTLKPEGDARLATVRLRYRVPATQEVLETEETLNRIQLRKTAREASASYRLATSVAQFAEILRESPHAAGVSYAQILEQAGAATNDLDRPADATEFLDLVRRASVLPK
jgi:Ca-activated chloride channel family protein